MKFEEFEPNQPKVLDEVRMGQSDLDAFINSDDAKGVVMGFEAEMCYSGKGGVGDDGELQEDYDTDESASDIDDICNFFHDGDYNTRREISEMRTELNSQYSEWVSEKMSELWGNVEEEEVKGYIEANDFDFDDRMRTYLADEMGLDEEAVDAAMKWTSNRVSSSREVAELMKTDQSFTHFAEARDAVDEHLDELVAESILEQDRNYDLAREDWEEYVSDDDDFSERKWLRYEGVRYMSDVLSSLNLDGIQWPYWTSQGSESSNEFNEDGANELARTLKRSLGVEVKVSSGYHGAKRTATRWIIEADGSLEADDGDMPAEIISPPMPLNECLTKMQEFFEWAQSEDAYTNESTGLHVGVSLPHVGGTVDYLKLALFLGDQYVLSQFDRESNTYCKSAISKIQDDIKNSPDKAKDALSLMKSDLIELAAKTLKQVSGHGKYTSINLKSGYIEFRSMGGDYIDKVPEIISMVKRYAYAMHIASRPDLYRDEYAKKLYKMLAPKGEGSVIDLFTKYASGKGMPQQALKSHLRQNQSQRNQKKQTAAADDQLLRDLQPDLQPDVNVGQQRFYILMDGEQVFIIRAANQGQANQMAREWLSQRSPEFMDAHRGQEVEVVPITSGM